MQTFTLDAGAWLRRLVGRNPLVRRADRVEAAATLLMALLAILALPIAAAAGTAMHESLANEFTQERLSHSQVDGTASADSRDVPQLYGEAYLTEISWEVDGLAHTETLRTGQLRAGEHLAVWVDEAGNRTTKPPSDADAVVQAAVAACGLWATALTPAVALWLLLRRRLTRARWMAWDRELGDLADDDGRSNNSA